MKEVILEAEGQTVESIIDNLQLRLCMLTGDHKLSNGDFSYPYTYLSYILGYGI